MGPGMGCSKHYYTKLSVYLMVVHKVLIGFLLLMHDLICIAKLIECSNPRELVSPSIDHPEHLKLWLQIITKKCGYNG